VSAAANASALARERIISLVDQVGDVGVGNKTERFWLLSHRGKG